MISIERGTTACERLGKKRLGLVNHLLMCIKTSELHPGSKRVGMSGPENAGVEIDDINEQLCRLLVAALRFEHVKEVEFHDRRERMVGAQCLPRSLQGVDEHSLGELWLLPFQEHECQIGGDFECTWHRPALSP